GARIDLASAIGVFAGPVCILLGQWLEGGRVSALLQRSAALIVIGATIGACMVSFSMRDLSAAVRDFRKVISEDAPNPFDLIDRIVNYATILRREGPVPLQRYARSESYGMLATGLNLICGNVAPEVVGTIMDRTFHERLEHNNAGAEVFEAAGGYLPTFGILGAVLGLIHTMEQLSDPSKVGAGIATAFVATVYGVGLANLVAYPVARKIRTRARTEKQLDKIVVTGIRAMREGMAATALRQLLSEGLTPPTQVVSTPAPNPEPQPKAA
ncbi:MAG TPA: MotA/TolQ/ExbB proton channel family protein, partial [Candidatus Binataceae bacterium]|nr:MotA/TolQ/ExbB proton channel family protein [Candidatus Binataceae bacterium]